MIKTQFGADFLNITVGGWSDGTLWNGWATPKFEFREAERIANIVNESHTESAWYDAERDEFCFCLNGEEERFGGTIEEVKGQKLKLYGIGTGEWIWEEVTAPTTMREHYVAALAQVPEVEPEEYDRIPGR